MAIAINRTEDKRVTLTHDAKDDNGMNVVSFSATIGTGQYEAGTYNRQIQNKTEYFKNLAKYKAIETEFETAYETEAAAMFGGNE